MWPIPGPDKSCYEGSVTMLEYLYVLNLECVGLFGAAPPHHVHWMDFLIFQIHKLLQVSM